MDFAEKSPVEFANEGAPLDLKLPNGKPWLYETGEKEKDGKPEMKQHRIWLAGIDSDAWRKAKRRLMDTVTENAKNNRELSEEEADIENLKLFASVFLKWEGFTDNGKPAACNQENAMKLMKWGPFIYDQVSAFINDRANFMKA